MAQVGLKRGPRESKVGPRWPQGTPRRVPDGPKSTQRDHNGSRRIKKELMRRLRSKKKRKRAEMKNNKEPMVSIAKTNIWRSRVAASRRI